MDNPVIKLVIPGEQYTLEIYETEPGKLNLSMYENGEDSYCGGWINVETKTLMEYLNKLLK